MEINESKADALDYNESSEHDIFDGAETLICGEDEEALYPGIECFDIVECNNPDLLVSSVRDSEHFDLPSDVLRLVAENPQDATIIYLRPELIIEEHRINRSKKKAETAGVHTSLPDRFPIITSKKYSYALTFYKEDKNCKAYLQLVDPAIAERFEFKNGKLYLQGVDAGSIDPTSYYDSENDGIFDIDLALLHCLYYMCLCEVKTKSDNRQELEQMLDDPRYIGHSTVFYVRDLLKYMGYKPNSNRKTETDLVERIKHFGKVLGLISDNDAGSERQIAYPVMIFEEYNENYNTVRFASPYMRALAIKVLLSGIDTHRPTHSHLIKPSIAMKHSKYDIAVFEIVSAIVRQIEQCGKGFPAHIRVITLLDRCPCFKKLLDEQGPTNKNNAFTRVFGRAWSYLENNKELKEKHPQVVFPFPPSYNKKDLEKVLEFTPERESKGKP